MHMFLSTHHPVLPPSSFYTLTIQGCEMSSPKPKSRMFELEILTHSKFWFVFPCFSSFVSLRQFPSAIQAFHCSHKGWTRKTTNSQTKKTPTKDNKTKQSQNSLRSVSSHCSCRWGLEKAAGKTRIRIKQGGNTEYRMWCSAAQGQLH